MLGDLFHLQRIDVYLFLIFAAVMVLAVRGQIPQVETVRKLIATFDDRGGVILLLALFTAWSFATSIRLFYWALGLISSGHLDAKDAVLMMALTWVTGSVWGLFAGALLKAQTVAPPMAVSSGMPATPGPAVTIPVPATSSTTVNVSSDPPPPPAKP